MSRIYMPVWYEVKFNGERLNRKRKLTKMEAKHLRAALSKLGARNLYIVKCS